MDSHSCVVTVDAEPSVSAVSVVGTGVELGARPDAISSAACTTYVVVIEGSPNVLAPTPARRECWSRDWPWPVHRQYIPPMPPCPRVSAVRIRPAIPERSFEICHLHAHWLATVCLSIADKRFILYPVSCFWACDVFLS